MDVMMNMTTEDVRVLRSHFRDRMSLEQFVTTLKQTLHDRIRSEVASSLFSSASPTVIL